MAADRTAPQKNTNSTDTSKKTAMTEEEVAAEQERQSSARVLRKVAPYLWPKDKPWVRKRVVWALIALIVSKMVTVATPLFYRDAVDALAGDGVPMFALGAIGLTIAYGMARLMGVGFQQLRDAIFARVAQRALRMLSLIHI